MAKSGTHRELPAWKQSLGLLERVYKLTQSLPIPDGQRLGDALLRAAAPLPALIAQSGRAAEAALLETEALILLTVRLGYLTESYVAPTLRTVDELLGTLPKVAPPSQKTPVASAAPGPVATPPPTPAVNQVAPAAPVGRALAPAAPSSPSRKPSAPAASASPAAPVEHDRLFVDGCNFLGCAPGYDLGDPNSRDRLLFRLQEYAREHPAHRVVVFFDGQRASSRVTSGVEERITSGIHNADDVILDHIRALPRNERRRCTLVTDDRELALRARNEGVRAESVQWLGTRFVQRRPAGNPRAGLSKNELSEWEQFFNEPPRRPGR